VIRDKREGMEGKEEKEGEYFLPFDGVENEIGYKDC